MVDSKRTCTAPSSARRPDVLQCKIDGGERIARVASGQYIEVVENGVYSEAEVPKASVVAAAPPCVMEVPTSATSSIPE